MRCPRRPPAGLPPLAEQDVIRNGFIYKPASVALVGDSVVLADQSTGLEAFADAREPLAQAFKAVGGARRRRVRGDRQPLQVEGLGHARPRRPGQRRRPARAPGRRRWCSFANDFKTLRGITRVFLAGDFNAYSSRGPDPGPQRGGLHQPRVDVRPRGGELQLRRPDRVARPRARERRCTRRRRGRRHLADQLLRVGLLRVQPVQLQRHQPVRRLRAVPVLRPQPGGHRASTCRRWSSRARTRSRSSAPTTSTVGCRTTPRRRPRVPRCWPVRSSSFARSPTRTRCSRRPVT